MPALILSHRSRSKCHCLLSDRGTLVFGGVRNRTRLGAVLSCGGACTGPEVVEGSRTSWRAHPRLKIALRPALGARREIRVILSGSGPDADGPRRLLGQDSSCRAARSKGYQDQVIRQPASVRCEGTVQVRGRAGRPHQPEQGETRVAIQIRGRIRATGRRRLRVSGEQLGGATLRGWARGTELVRSGDGGFQV